MSKPNCCIKTNTDTNNHNQNQKRDDDLGSLHLQTQISDSKGSFGLHRHALKKCILSLFQNHNENIHLTKNDSSTTLASISCSSISSSSICDTNTSATHHNYKTNNRNTKATLRSTIMRFFLLVLVGLAVESMVLPSSLQDLFQVSNFKSRRLSRPSPLAVLFPSLNHSPSSSCIEVNEKDLDDQSAAFSTVTTTATSVLSPRKTLSDNTCTVNDNTLALHHIINATDYNFLLNVTTQVGRFNPLTPATTTITSINHSNTIMTNHNSRRVVTVHKPQKFIPVLEARGSAERDIDKDEYGHRRDTIPIANAVDEYNPSQEDRNNNNNRINSAVFQFLEEELDDGQGVDHYAIQSNLALERYLSNVAHGIIVRINPGTLSPLSQKKCDDMLRELSNAGVIILTHPDVMSTLGAKDVSLVFIFCMMCVHVYMYFHVPPLLLLLLYAL